MRRLSVVVPLACAGYVACLGATAVRASAYTEVACERNAPVAVVVASDASELADKLAQGVVSSTRTGCASGFVGDVVLTPPGAKEGPVAFAVMTRADGQDPARCGDPTLPQADRDQCIVAKRALRFRAHEVVDVRVDLRDQCRGVLCAADQTCVRGQCVGVDVARACVGSCDEGTLASAPASGVVGLSLTQAPVSFLSDAGSTPTGVTVCSVTADGRGACWGRNDNGQMGVVQPASFTQVQAVPAFAGATVIGVGHDATCAALDGGVGCLGSDGDGQRGGSATAGGATVGRVPGWP